MKIDGKTIHISQINFNSGDDVSPTLKKGVLLNEMYDFIDGQTDGYICSYDYVRKLVPMSRKF